MIDNFASVPGSLSEEAKHIRWMRVATDIIEGQEARVYMADVPGGFLKAIVSQDPVGKRGKLLWHVSVSHTDSERKPDRCPNWDELKSAVYRLVQKNVCFVLIFPRRTAEYVNAHDTCLHLWESEKEIDA